MDGVRELPDGHAPPRRPRDLRREPRCGHEATAGRARTLVQREARARREPVPAARLVASCRRRGAPVSGVPVRRAESGRGRALCASARLAVVLVPQHCGRRPGDLRGGRASPSEDVRRLASVGEDELLRARGEDGGGDSIRADRFRSGSLAVDRRRRVQVGGARTAGARLKSDTSPFAGPVSDFSRTPTLRDPDCRVSDFSRTPPSTPQPAEPRTECGTTSTSIPSYASATPSGAGSSDGRCVSRRLRAPEAA